MRRGASLQCPLGRQRHIAAFRVTGQKKLLVVRHFLQLPPVGCSGQHVQHRRGRRCGQQVGVRTAFGGPVADIVGRQHQVALRCQDHLRAGGLVHVAWGFDVALDGAVLVTQHRAAAARRLLRQRHQRRGFDWLAQPVNRQVIQAVGGDGVARACHKVGFTSGGQGGGQLGGGQRFEQGGRLEFTAPAAVVGCWYGDRWRHRRAVVAAATTAGSKKQDKNQRQPGAASLLAMGVERVGQHIGSFD